MLALDVPDTEKTCLKRTLIWDMGMEKKYEMGEKYIYFNAFAFSHTYIVG